jgi:hypothetical protein
MEIVANDTVLQELQRPSSPVTVALEDSISFLYEEGVRILASRQRRQVMGVNHETKIVGAVRSSADTIQVTFYVTDVRISSVVPQEEVIAALNAVANSRLDEVTGFDVLRVFANEPTVDSTPPPVNLALVLPLTILGALLLCVVVIVLVSLYIRWRVHTRRRWTLTSSHTFESRIDLNENVDAHSVGIQHGSPQIGGRHRVTLADLATAVNKRRTLQPTPHLTAHTTGPVPYHSIQSSAVQNTSETQVRSPTVEVDTRSHLEGYRQTGTSAVQPKFLPLTALVSSSVEVTGREEVGGGDNMQETVEDVGRRTDYGNVTGSGETGSGETGSGDMGRGETGRTETGREELVRRDILQTTEVQPRVDREGTDAAVSVSQQQYPVEPEVQVIEHNLSLREQELEQETLRLQSENAELKKTLSSLRDELDDERHFAKIKQRNLEHIQRVAGAPEHTAEREMTKKVKPSNQQWAYPASREEIVSRALERAERKARRAWSEQPSLSMDRSQLGTPSQPHDLRGLPKLVKRSIVGTSVREEPATHLTSSHLTTDYTTEKDSLASLHVHAKQKKHRSWQKRSKIAPVDEDFSGAVDKPHSRRRRNKVAPAELEFSGAVARRVENTVKSELAMMDMGGGNVQLMRVWPVQPVTPTHMTPSYTLHPSAVGHPQHVPLHLTPSHVQTMPARPSPGNSLFYPYP